jgi:predicted nucleotidyltransferase component of viral defense system
VTARKTKDLAASVHQRLLNRARAVGRPFAELLQHYAMERFLYRLSKSPHAPSFVLKGALALTMWGIPRSRTTKDIDFLGQADNSVDSVVITVQGVCLERVEPDGMAFDASTVEGERIIEGADYEGVRVRFGGSLGSARVTMQLDIAFGDAVVPAPQLVAYPTILDFPPPRLKVYSRESTISEKLEAMVRLGLLNSRMKDFFDIWLLSARFSFDGATLSYAIQRTFEARRDSEEACGSHTPVLPRRAPRSPVAGVCPEGWP